MVCIISPGPGNVNHFFIKNIFFYVNLLPCLFHIPLLFPVPYEPNPSPSCRVPRVSHPLRRPASQLPAQTQRGHIILRRQSLYPVKFQFPETICQQSPAGLLTVSFSFNSSITSLNSSLTLWDFFIFLQ